MKRNGKGHDRLYSAHLWRGGLLLLVLVVVLCDAASAASAKRDNPAKPGQPASAASLPRGAGSLQDGGFELGTPSPVWTESSTNFGTPLCDVPVCGSGLGTGPHQGDFWAWFGGIEEFEEGRLSQIVTLPLSSIVRLSFYQELPLCSGSANDFLQVRLNTTQVYLVRGNDPSCGTLGYVKKTIDITAFQGQTVTLELRGITNGPEVTNFFIDDVAIETAAGILIFYEDFESGDTSGWSATVTPPANQPPTLGRVVATWAQLSDGRSIEQRNVIDVGGISGVPAVLGPTGLPREIVIDSNNDGFADPDNPVVAQAMGVLRGGNPAVVPVLGPGLPSSMALVVAQAADQEGDAIIYRWQFPVTPNVSYYSTGPVGSPVPTGDLITNLPAYNRNSILVESPDLSFPIQDAEIHIGGLFPVTVSVTDAAHANPGCPAGVPNFCRSFWNFEYDRGIELELRDVRGRLLNLNSCVHPNPGDPDVGPGNPGDTVELTFVAGINLPALDANRFEALPDVWFRVACNALGLGVGDDFIVDMPPAGPTVLNVNPGSYLARNPMFIGNRIGGGARMTCLYPLANPESNCASTNAWKASTAIDVIPATLGPATGAWPFVEQDPAFPPLTMFIPAIDVFGPSLADRQPVTIKAFETEEVTFTLFDSGSLADDSFRLEIDSVIQGTTPPGGESVFGPDFLVLGELTPGTHEACVTVTLAPDDIGTYTLSVFGATFTGGATEVSGAPVQGTRTCYTFVVPLR